jgi:rhodanese-related sulfurtransferase
MAKGIKDLLAEARAQITEIDTAGAAELLARDDDTLFLDVREAHEFESGRLPGAHLVPRGMLEPRAAADSPAQDEELADPARRIVVYCGSGARSALAAASLQQLGFTNVLSMAGGIQAWEQDGRSLER